MRTSILALALLVGPLASTAHAQHSPYRNPGMRIAGIVLTSVASAILVGGVTAGLAIGGRGTVAIGPAIIGVSAVGSLPFAGVGIPLWVVGARPSRHATIDPPSRALTLRPAGLGFTF